MSERRLFLDEGPGETRAVVTLDGAPERLLIERAGDVYPRLGARYVARVLRLERATGLALLDLGDDGQGALRLKADRAPPTQGAAIEIEIAIEPQGDKAAVARLLGPAEGAPRRTVDAQSLEQRLLAHVPGGSIQTGRKARQVADEAEDRALAIEHGLAGGGSIAIEPTRALTAIDVDLGAGSGQDPKRAARQANLRAIGEVARLLRLKALGGLVVIDLVGRGHDGQALAQAAQTAFSAEQPGVVIGPVTKFGTLELALPRRFRPVSDILSAGGRGPSVETLALILLRAIEREAQADPGGRILARAVAEIVAAAQIHLPHLSARFGSRFQLIADPALARDAFEVSSS